MYICCTNLKMRFIIDISQSHSKAIQNYLDKGQYASLSQFITTAIENQLAIEETDLNSFTHFNLSNETQKKDFIKSATIESYDQQKLSLINIPEYKLVVKAPEFKDLVFASQNIPENDVWIWGQINKIFPVKIGVRVLHQLLTTNEVLELDEFLEKVVKEAITIGDNIRTYEDANNKMRSEKISAGLPSADEKSQTRYKSQFMVYLRKDGLMDGAMSLMRFCNVYEEKKKYLIGLTEEGLKFSSISNPVLDSNTLDTALNEEESLFYINHVKKNIKGEYAGMKWMLEKISDGKNETQSLNTEIEEIFGKKWRATDAVINTQRAGITARMTELGLIDKEKEGIYVKYKVSEKGKLLFK